MKLALASFQGDLLLISLCISNGNIFLSASVVDIVYVIYEHVFLL